MWGRMLEEVRGQCRELRHCIDVLACEALRNRQLREKLAPLLTTLEGIVESLRLVSSGSVERIARQVSNQQVSNQVTNTPDTAGTKRSKSSAQATARTATGSPTVGKPAQGAGVAKGGRRRRTSGVCILKGTSPEFAIPSLFQFLERNAKTGVLRLTMSGENIEFEIVDGEIVHAVTDRRPEEERLGSLLVARGAISREQLDEFLAKADGRTMGEAMNADQLVSMEDLQGALSQQIQMLFSRVFATTEASFAFYEGTRRQRELPARCNVVQLLLESARVKDERCRDRLPNS